MTGDQRFHAVIASGGTGGHFYPSLAIAQEIQQGGNQVTMLLAGRHVTDQIRVAVEHDILAMPTPACPMPSLRRPAAIPPFLIRFSGSILQARRWAKREHPDVVLGMGSFASAPSCLGLRSVGVPLVLHEGNSWMGKANRWLSRFARVAALSLPLSPECPCHCPRAQTGMPLRQSLLQAAARPERPLDYMVEGGLDPNLKTVLVFGGSQGAEAINALVPKCLAGLGDDAHSLQIIHFTGPADTAAIAQTYQQAGVRAIVQTHDPHIERAYLAADIVVCRAGASSACELALFGKPAILIPLPTAAENHQHVNAQTLAQDGAAWLLPQQDATPELLADLLGDFLRDGQTWAEMGNRIRAYARPDAVPRVVQLLRDQVRAKPQ